MLMSLHKGLIIYQFLMVFFSITLFIAAAATLSTKRTCPACLSKPCSQLSISSAWPTITANPLWSDSIGLFKQCTQKKDNKNSNTALDLKLTLAFIVSP